MENHALGFTPVPCQDFPILEEFPCIILKLWQKIEFKEKRAITLEEHRKIIAGERNPEWRAYYEVLWHVGEAQTDTACLCGENAASAALGPECS